MNPMSDFTCSISTFLVFIGVKATNYLRRILQSLAPRAWLFLVVSAFIAPSISVNRISLAQPDDSALRSRFLQGITLADQKVRALSIRATCATITRITLDPAIPATEQREDFQCAILDSNVMMTGILEKSENTFFKVRNDKYAFGLERSQSATRPSLQFVEQLGVNPKIDATVSQYEAMVRGAALSGYYFLSHPVFESFENGSFKITQVSQVNRDGVELVRVEFDGIVTEPAEDGSGEQPGYTYSDAFLICDPSKNWVMMEYGGDSYVHVNKGQARHRMTLEIGKTVRGVPLATRLEAHTTSLNSETRIDRISDIEFEEREASSSEFLLTHYGLPEPNFQRSTFGVWLWYLIGAIFFVGSGWFLLKRGSPRIQTH